MDVDVTALKLALQPTHQAVSLAVKNLIKDELFTPRYNISLDEERSITRERLLKVASLGLLSPSDYSEDTSKLFVIHEALTLADPSLVTAFTIQFNILIGSLLNLSTRHMHYVPDLLSMKITGSFALTEIGYGSTALYLRTTASYEPSTQTFDLHTPDNEACKFWVSGYKSTHAVVFARLVNAKGDQGVQAFFIQLRSVEGRLLQGIEELELGAVTGPNGAGCSLMRFTHVKIPLEALMNKHSDLAPDGTFTSQIPSKKERFNKIINRLIAGRICMTVIAISATKLAGLVAYRYAAQRLAVGPSGASDTPIMEYQLQQNALVPYYARVCVLDFGALYAKKLFQEGDSFVNTYISALKALSAWTALSFSRIARERMGGAGYLAVNRLSACLSGNDAVLTAEGDAGILMIKTVNDLMKRASKGKYAPPQLSLCPATQLPQVQDFNTLPLLLELMRAREVLAFRGFMDVLARDKQAGISAYETVSIRSSAKVQHLAKAFVERILAEQAIERTRDNPRVSGVLSLVTELYMLDAVKTDLNWFMLNRLVNEAAAKSLVGRWSSSIKALTPLLGKIVEAFDIPEELVRAPIAGDYVGYNDKLLSGELLPKL